MPFTSATWAKTALACLATTALLTASAGAANFTSSADALNTMGLFAGSELGYELDRAPERAEAAVMLVRLLGAETEALAATDNAAPFTDVPDWAAPYINWLYENGLTTGATETTFEPYGTCSSQMYATFLLRALGYSDGTDGDFSYDTALDFAQSLDVVDAVNYSPDAFLRDNMVAMSYTALAVTPKDADATLLAQLVEAGAVEADVAQPYLDRFDSYFALDKIIQASAADDRTHTQITGEMQVGTADMGYLTMTMDLFSTTALDLETPNNSQLVVEGSTVASMGDQSQTTYVSYVYSDGIYYFSTDDQMFKYAADFNDILGQTTNGTDLLALAQSNPICYYESITAMDDGTWLITYDADAYSSTLDQMLGGMLSAGGTTNMEVNLLQAELVVTADGIVQSATSTADMVLTQQGSTVQMYTETTTTLIEYGNDVSVELPENLDAYVQIIGAADGSTEMVTE